MVTIIFESHSTTFDNEKHLSSGHNDVALSLLGIKQAKELGERYRGEHFDAIFCSDLQRSYRTAEIAFKNRFPIIKDKRLRECDYGELTQHPSKEVDPQKIKHINKPFPNGESYEQAMQRMKTFLDDLKKNYNNKKVMIIGHRATQYGLEYLINGINLETLVTTSFKWQPGWRYQFMSNLKIRSYKPSDKDVVWRLHKEGLTGHGIKLVGKSILDQDMDDIEGIYLKDGDFVVGELGGEIVAMGAFRKINNDVAELKRMRVDKSFQRRGFGHEIIQELEQRAKKKGYKKMILSTNKKWEDAQNFYKKNGYLKTGRGVRYKIYHVVFYEKELK